VSDCCPDCVRRSWLVGRLAGHIEHSRGDRAAVRTLLALPDRRLLAAVGGSRRHAIESELRRLDSGATLEGWRQAGVATFCRHSAAYPQSLHRLPDPPAAIHVVGDAGRLAGLLEAPAVAVVGARRCSPDGAAMARGLGRGCSAAGVAVVSGMALGVDAAAHEGALEAGGLTVAVLAGAPERSYPARWRALHGQIAAGGAVLSEMPPGTASYRWGFPARNRIIAALSGLVVVVEARERSGSLITAEIAADLGVSVGAVPGLPGRPLSEAPNALVRDGAALVRDSEDVLEELLGIRVPRAPQTTIEPELAQVATIVARGADTPERIAAAGGTADGLLAALTRLELLGVVERRGAGRYVPGSTRWQPGPD